MDGLWFPDYVRQLNMCSVILRIVLCVLCGGVVGIEREWRHRTAGLKTHILVCMGAAVCMITGQYAVEYFPMSSIDPTRIGAQVVSGIGFLGVGTIIVTKHAKVKGLTTAAGLWVAACIGLAIGIGFFEIALIVTTCVLLLFLVVKHLKVFNGEISTFLYVELEDVAHVRALMEVVRESDCSVFQMDMQQAKSEVGGRVGVLLGIRGDAKAKKEILSTISRQTYVMSFIEMEDHD